MSKLPNAGLGRVTGLSLNRMSVCLGDADNRREGRNISRTTLSILWLRNLDFKT